LGELCRAAGLVAARLVRLRQHKTLRPHHWLLSGRRLVALAGDAAGIATASGGYLTFRRSMCEPGGVLAWDLSREADAQ
jgi:hypothetical protein